MSGRLLLAAASVALLSAFVACDARRPAPASATIAQRADAIQGGSADTTSTFAVSVLDDQDDICSGTLIAPNLVLTARHCVATDNGGDTVDCAHDQFDAPSAASTLRVSLKATAPSFDEAEYQATKVIVPTSAAFCGERLRAAHPRQARAGRRGDTGHACHRPAAQPIARSTARR